MLLKHIKNQRIIGLIKLIKESIANSMLEGNVFVYGDAVTNSLLGQGCNCLHVAVTTESGNLSFANWMALDDESFDAGKNPISSQKMSVYTVFLKNNKEYKDIPIICETVDGKLIDHAKKKDFTINTVYYNISKDEIVDPTDIGLSDIFNKTLRCVEKPDVVFKEKPELMLQAIMQSTRFGLGIDIEAWLGIVKNSNNILNIGKSKIKEYVHELLLGEKPSAVLERMRYCGLLENIFKDVFDERSIYEDETHTTYDHTMRCIDLSNNDICIRLAALYHDVGKLVTNSIQDQTQMSASVAKSDLKAFGFDEDICKRVESAILLHTYFKDTNTASEVTRSKLRKFIKKCGDNIDIALELMNINLLSNYNEVRKPMFVKEIIERIEEEIKEDEKESIVLPINGKTIINELHIKKGPHIGVCLSNVREAMLINPNLTKQEALGIVRETLKKLAI